MSLISHYKVITVTHHNLDVKDIGNFYIAKQASKFDLLRQVKVDFNIEECLYLETCNRVSFILFGEQIINKEFLKSFFKLVNPNLDAEILNSINKFISIYSGEGALQHIFELASSIDSLVVGEREIFRQFRSSYELCKKEKLTGDYLRLLEKQTVSTAKKVYSSTKIGEKSLSVVALAIQSLLNNNPKKDSRILLIGSGETNSLVGKFLKKYKFENISIYNRSLDNASDLSKMLSCPAYHINELKNVHGAFDIIFICTSANEIVIDVPLYQAMINQNEDQKILIDLAVPRNISQEVVDNFNTTYIDIESLKSISEENLKHRKKEIEKARPIIDEQILEFKNTFQQRHIEKSLSAIPQAISAVKQKAVNEVYGKRIDELDLESKELLLEMMDYMEKKCISVPMALTKVNK